MSGETLFAIAHEMLSITNMFTKEVTEIKFTNSQQDEIRLLDLVKEQTSQHNHRFRGKSEKNIQLAYKAIAFAMSAYLENYTAPFSFKQRTKAKFEAWLHKICEAYSISNPAVPSELTISKTETDTSIAMLKLLHARDGVTYADFHTELGITERAVQKNLVKLSPSLYTGPEEPYAPFRLGGQPLRADITLVSKEECAAKKRFRTLNSVHPLVLQENIMQLATLLKALCHQFYDREDELGRLIAVDIWSQMSEYAQMKIINYYAFDDPDLADFLNMLKDDCPDDHACTYRSEKDLKQLLDDIEMPIDQALPYLMKAPGRTGIITLKSGMRILAQQLSPAVKNDGTKAYEALDPEGNTTLFTKDQVADIQIH